MFVNTRYLSPVVMDGITTAPRDSYEWHEWWDEQEKRCREGYTVAGTTITGRHYHYLNFWRILRQPDGGGTKRRLPPRFLDIDHDFYHEYDRCREMKKDLLVVKRRQCGFSFKNAQICGYEFSFVPDSYTVITSGVESYSVNTMRMVLDGLDSASNTEFYKHRQPNSEDFIQAMFQDKSDDGTVSNEGLLSIVHRITASNIQALVGKTLSMLLYEEIGKFKGVKDVKAYIDPGMEEMGQKTGIQVLIGTGGEEHESIDEVRDMYYDPETYGIMGYDDPDAESGIDDAPKKKVGYFISGDKFTETTDEDGNSHPELARAVILKRREQKKNDKKILLREITQFPLTAAEAFMTPEGGKFNAYLLNQQKARILKDATLREQVRIGDLNWKRDNQNNIIGVDWTDDKINGRYRMTEPPLLDGKGEPVQGLYIAGTDSYDKDKAADEKRSSFGACRIHKQWYSLDESDNLPVCGLIERPPTSDEFYEDTAKMCVFYGWAMNLIEYSNILIFDWYRRNGFARMIRQRPETAYANVAKSNVQNKDGIDPAMKPMFEQLAIDWVEKNSHKIFDIQLIDKLIMYRSDKNCDESIAFMLAILHAHDNALVAERPKEDEKKWNPGRYVYDSKTGGMRRVF